MKKLDITKDKVVTIESDLYGDIEVDYELTGELNTLTGTFSLDVDKPENVCHFELGTHKIVQGTKGGYVGVKCLECDFEMHVKPEKELAIYAYLARNSCNELSTERFK